MKLEQPTLLEKVQKYAVEVKNTRYGLNPLTFFTGNYPWGNNPSPAMILLFRYFTDDQIVTFIQKNATHISNEDILKITQEKSSRERLSKQSHGNAQKGTKRAF